LLAQIGDVLGNKAVSVSKYKSLIKIRIDTNIARFDFNHFFCYLYQICNFIWANICYFDNETPNAAVIAECNAQFLIAYCDFLFGHWMAKIG